MLFSDKRELKIEWQKSNLKDSPLRLTCVSHIGNIVSEAQNYQAIDPTH